MVYVQFLYGVGPTPHLEIRYFGLPTWQWWLTGASGTVGRRGSRIQKGGGGRTFRRGGGGSYRNFRSGSKLLQGPGQINKQKQIADSRGGGGVPMTKPPPPPPYPRMVGGGGGGGVDGGLLLPRNLPKPYKRSNWKVECWRWKGQRFTMCSPTHTHTSK